MRRIVVLLFVLACSKGDRVEHVNLDLIQIVGDARMRTDTVGGGKHVSESSFVLVDASNTSATGAYVTLGGAFTDATGASIGSLKPQSLWIPPNEVRTFALIDAERVPRPTATSAKIEVRGALIASPPRAKIVDLHTFDDDGKIVLQASLVNDADRMGSIIVIASFHGKDGRPMTRPFNLIEIGAKQTQNVQFVGPPGSVRGAIYIGEETY
ncbi:MAG: hypothetical protein M4D80_22390 [Myxococcota bacterium]|nr:hypothetical protein [Myxococcota bacterium]